MAATPQSSTNFTALDVRRDMNRFGGSFFHFVKNGKPTGDLCSLQSLGYPAWDDDERNPRTQVAWDNPRLRIFYRSCLTNEMAEAKGRKGVSLQLTPSWKHKGYTMYNNRSGITKMGWISMAAHRQYRWGLSARAFETRTTRGFPTLSGGTSSEGSAYLVGWLWAHGPRYTTVNALDLSHNSDGYYGAGGALSSSLAVHAVAPNTGALVHNAATVLGFYYQGELLVEHQAKDFTRTINDQVTYVPTRQLTSLYSDVILPASVRGNQPPPPDGMVQYGSSQFEQWARANLGGLSDAPPINVERPARPSPRGAAQVAADLQRIQEEMRPGRLRTTSTSTGRPRRPLRRRD